MANRHAKRNHKVVFGSKRASGKGFGAPLHSTPSTRTNRRLDEIKTFWMMHYDPDQIIRVCEKCNFDPLLLTAYLCALDPSSLDQFKNDLEDREEMLLISCAFIEVGFDLMGVEHD